MQRLLTDDEVTRAMVSPPSDTRAFFRGECLRRYPAQVAAASWDSVVFDLGRENLVRIPTMEPLRGTREHVGALFEASATAQELVDTITGS
jgi:proteasome accessory factor A